MGRFTKVHTVISASLGALCIAAYLVWGIAYRFTPPHLWFWLGAGIVFLMPCIIRFAASKLGIKPRHPKLLRVIMAVLMSMLGLLIAAFLIFEVTVAIGAGEKYGGDLDCIVVLGARVRGEVPSKSLAYRIDAAYEYLSSHGGCIAVLSGGTGDGEDISEAECMRRELTARGISEDRLIIEDRSTSTVENLRFSSALIGDGKTVGIVSSGFHICRAKLIASSVGIDAVGIAAKSDAFILPHYMMREFATVVGDLLRGNIKISDVFGG